MKSTKIKLVPEARMALWQLSHGHEETNSPISWEGFKRKIGTDPNAVASAVHMAFEQNMDLTIERLAVVLMQDKQTIKSILLS